MSTETKLPIGSGAFEYYLENCKIVLCVFWLTSNVDLLNVSKKNNSIVIKVLKSYIHVLKGVLNGSRVQIMILAASEDT